MRIAVLVALSAKLAACGEVQEVPDAAPGTIADAARSGDAAGGTPDAGGAEPDAAPGLACSASTECASDRYCDFARNQCGTFGAGVCRPTASVCPGDGPPVCGCDDTLYGDECLAAESGADLSETGGCVAQKGTLRCGHSFCSNKSEYCRIQFAALPGAPTDYRCISFGGDCRTCSCVGGGGCGGACTNDSGGVTVTCPPPP